jgi:hypothetical protein
MATAGTGDADGADEAPDSGVGAGFVSAPGVAVIALVVLGAMVATIYALIALWPASPSAGSTPSYVGGVKIMLDREQRLFAIVGLAGLLGGFIHSARSLYEYAGNRVLRWSWLLMYVSLPLVGAALAVVFYVILRGGLITGTAAQVNFFGFAAISALVGLFSPEAADKLKQIFATLLAPAQQGRDRLTTDDQARADSLEPESGPVGTTITIRGWNLSRATAVLFFGARAVATVISSTEVTAVVPPGAASGRVSVMVGEVLVTVRAGFRVEG